MTGKTRIAAVLLAVTVLFVMLGSALFVAAEVGHDCVGDGCPICCQTHIFRNILKHLSLAVCAAGLAAAFTCALCGSVSSRADVISNDSLVSLGVKLSD